MATFGGSKMFDDFRAFFSRNSLEPYRRNGRDFAADAMNDRPAQKSIIVAIVNQKGGVGKTTTCINLAAGLAKKNFKVLIIDLDPQSNASLGLNVNVDEFSSSIYDVLVNNLDLEQAIVPTYVKNLDIAPASSLLTGAQLEIADLLGRERLLRTGVWKMLNSHIRYYDYILMDCSPSLNLLTINGLVAAQCVLVPIQAHYFSLEGLKELFSTLKVVRDRINSELEILGILPCIVDIRKKMTREMLDQLKDYFKDKMLKTVIRMNIALAEASAHGQSIFDFNPYCNGAKDYSQLVDEMILLTRPDVGFLRTQSAMGHETKTTG
jgi:chromosome partitioning protein